MNITAPEVMKLRETTGLGMDILAEIVETEILLNAEEGQ